MQEFIRILRLHQDHPAHLVEQAVEQALAFGCVHLDGVVVFVNDIGGHLLTKKGATGPSIEVCPVGVRNPSLVAEPSSHAWKPSLSSFHPQEQEVLAREAPNNSL